MQFFFESETVASRYEGVQMERARDQKLGNSRPNRQIWVDIRIQRHQNRGGGVLVYPCRSPGGPALTPPQKGYPHSWWGMGRAYQVGNSHPYPKMSYWHSKSPLFRGRWVQNVTHFANPRRWRRSMAEGGPNERWGVRKTPLPTCPREGVATRTLCPAHPSRYTFWVSIFFRYILAPS